MEPRLRPGFFFGCMILSKNQRQTTLIRYLPLLIGGGMIALILVTLVVYWPGLTGGFMLDDYENLRPLSDLDQGRISWHDAIFSTSSGPLGRPVAMATFAANMVFSGPDVWMFKYTNLMIHALCGVLVFFLAGRLLLALNHRDFPPERAWPSALLIAGLWLLAPLSASTTLYLVQRMTQLATLFCLSGLVSYVIGRGMLATERPKTGWAMILSSILVWLPLAALSKETGVLLPLLLFVVELFLFKFSATKPQRRFLYLFFALVVGLPALITLAVLIVDPGYFLASYSGRPFTLSERVFTESRVLLFYLRNLVLPQGDILGLFHDDYVLSTGLLSPVTTLLSILAWISVLVATVVFYRRKDWRLALFGIWFFLAGHALESTIFPLELVFEHRNYLPAFGIFFAVGTGISLLYDRLGAPRSIAAFALLLPLTYAFATYQRADTWSSWPKLLRSAELAHPRSPRLHVELASLYTSEGNASAALSELNKVESLRPDAASGVALQRLLIYCQDERVIPDSVYRDFPDTMSNNDAGIYTINTLRAVTRVLYTDKCPAIKVGALTKRLERWVRNSGPAANGGRLWDLHYELAHIERFSGHTKSAIEHLRAADRINPNRPEALLTEMRYQVEIREMAAASSTLKLIRTRFNKTTQTNADLIARYKSLEDIVDQYLQQRRRTAH